MIYIETRDAALRNGLRISNPRRSHCTRYLTILEYHNINGTLQKLKVYSNPVGGHLTFISQWPIAAIIVNRNTIFFVLRNVLCINYAIGFRDADIIIQLIISGLIVFRSVCYMCTNIPVL